MNRQAGSSIAQRNTSYSSDFHYVSKKYIIAGRYLFHRCRRDILEREKRRGQRQITDPVLLQKIILFLADDIGSTISVSSIGNTLVSEGLLTNDKRKGAPSAHTIENVVYFELLRRGYDVAIGKVDNAEVDFIATKADDKLYVQVTESMTSEDVRRRELAPLQKIKDNYEKIVLSLDPGMDASYDGIKSLNLIQWLIHPQ